MNEVDKLLEEIKLIQLNIIEIQLNCEHESVDRQQGNSTGYDGDKWWVDNTCNTCNKRWREYEL